MRQRVIQREFLSQRMFPGGFEMADDDLLIKLHIRCPATLGAMLEKIRVEAGQDEELIGTLDMDEESLMRPGVL